MRRCYKRSEGLIIPFCSAGGAHVLKGQDLFAVEREAAAILDMLPATSLSLRRRLLHMHLSRDDSDAAIEDLLQAGFIESSPLLHHIRSQVDGLRGRGRLRSLRALHKRIATLAFVLRCHSLRRRLSHVEADASAPDGQHPKQILVIVHGGIGDMVLATPVLRRLHEADPATAIDVLVRAKNAAMYRMCPLISKVIPFCGVKEMFRRRGGPSEFARDLYRSHYHMAISLMEHFGGTCRWLNGKAIAYVTGAKVRVGTWDHVCRSARVLAKPLLTHPVPFRREHEVVRGTRLLQQVGVTSPPGRLEVWYRSQEKKQAQRIIARCKAARPRSVVIGIAPFTSRGKMWPLDRWAQLLKKLSEVLDHTALVFGGPGDAGAATVLNALCGNRLVNLAGQTPLLLFCALLGQLDLLLSVDTGAAHIGAAHRLRQVVLYGPVSPRKYGPWKNPHARVLRASAGSMEKLAVEDVYCTIRELWRQSATNT